jgi:hypothetical protein
VTGRIESDLRIVGKTLQDLHQMSGVTRALPFNTGSRPPALRAPRSPSAHTTQSTLPRYTHAEAFSKP